MFAGGPIDVDVAESEQDALARIEATRPAVVLASYTKTGIDGFAIARHVSRQPQLQSVAVLLLLSPRAVNEHRIAESGAMGFLTKPLKAMTVIARVREAMGLPHDDGISREELAAIVSDAVVHAIDAYEHARGHELPHATPHALEPTEINEPHDRLHSLPKAEADRLQHEMGLDDMAFAEAPAPQAPAVAPELAAEMGVTGFSLDTMPDEPPEGGVTWIAEQLAPQQLDEEEVRELAEQRAAVPIRHVVEAVRAGVAHLTELVHPHKPEGEPDQE